MPRPLLLLLVVFTALALGGGCVWRPPWNPPFGAATRDGTPGQAPDASSDAFAAADAGNVGPADAGDPNFENCDGRDGNVPGACRDAAAPRVDAAADAPAPDAPPGHGDAGTDASAGGDGGGGGILGDCVHYRDCNPAGARCGMLVNCVDYRCDLAGPRVVLPCPEGGEDEGR